MHMVTVVVLDKFHPHIKIGAGRRACPPQL